MEYRVNIIGELRNKEFEKVFMESESRKGLKLVRYMILLSSLGFFLVGIGEFILRKDISIEILIVSFITRIVVFIIGVILFVIMKRTKDIKVISRSILVFTSVVYGVYFYVEFYFIPAQIMSPTFFVILLSTCLFMMPNRWIINLCFSLAYSALFIIAVPYLCTTTPVASRIIAISYLCWNIIVIGTLFYNINIYKRNYFTKALQLEELANTDQLTKTHNRKACDDILGTQCTTSTKFSVIMFDIDDFKLINDTYGHVSGDDVIVNITDITRRIIRKNDILARWGGEEFVIVMVDADLKEAEELAERLKKQLTLIEHDGIKQSITCSFGVTAFVDGDNVKSIIRRADQLLYSAKEYGKNRVVSGI